VLRVSLLPEAADELDAATDWYEGQAPGLGAAFRGAVLATLHAIAENPRRFPPARREYRRAVISRFPYSVFFTVEEDGIVITAVFHSARDPRQLDGRR